MRRVAPRMLSIMVVAVVVLFGGKAFASGRWAMMYPVPANFWDFSVGKGWFCWVDSTSAPNYYVGSTACASGSPLGAGLVVDHRSDFSKNFTYANGHAQRIAVAQGPTAASGLQLVVTTAEGYLWFYKDSKWGRGPALPASLPRGMTGYAVTRLVYEAVDYYTGLPSTSPIWILGKDGHVYRLTGLGGDLKNPTPWVDVSNVYGIGTVAQLSYSAMWDAVVATFADGSSAYYDDNADAWYYITTAAQAPLAVDSNLTFYFGAGFYGAGGLFQSWCSSRLSNQTCLYGFDVGTWPTWYDLDSLPTVPGYSQILSNSIDETYPVTANAHQPNEEIPINIVEGSDMQLSSAYGGGPRDVGYADLFFVQTNSFRVYVYEVAQ